MSVFGITLAKTAKRQISDVSPLPLKVGCCIDLSQRQAKAQVQMPFHSKPPISCALDLTFFEVVTKPW